jgi:hypothetical protein
MCRMTAYTIGEGQVERLVSQSKQTRFWVAIASSLILAVAVAVLFRYPEFMRASHRWAIPLLAVLCLPPLVRILWTWNRWPQTERNRYQKVRVEISGDTIRLSNASRGDILLNASEILRAEDRPISQGIYLRTKNRYRWFLVPRTLDDFASLKRDLVQMGIPMVQRRFLPNWEEFVGAAAFCGTMLCVLLTRNPKILTVNLLAAALVSAGGIYVVRANPDSVAHSRKLAVGVLLPVLIAAAALWFSVRGW